MLVSFFVFFLVFLFVFRNELKTLRFKCTYRSKNCVAIPRPNFVIPRRVDVVIIILKLSMGILRDVEVHRWPVFDMKRCIVFMTSGIRAQSKLRVHEHVSRKNLIDID